MIESFIHKGLRELYNHGKSSRIQSALAGRILRWLDAIDSASLLSDLNVPGFNFHDLEGKPKRYSIHVNGPWYIKFEWHENSARFINLENYH